MWILEQPGPGFTSFDMDWMLSEWGLEFLGDGSEMLDMLVERGIDQQHIDIVRHSGIDLERWLCGFESVESSVHETVRRLKEHPLMPKDVRISGFIMDSATGELTRVEE